jgi:hypothetical protein
MPIGDPPIGPNYGGYFQPGYTWYQNTTTKKVTETLEYDEKGNLVKRTIVTEEFTPKTYQQPYNWNGTQIHPATKYVATFHP